MRTKTAPLLIAATILLLVFTPLAFAQAAGTVNSSGAEFLRNIGDFMFGKWGLALGIIGAVAGVVVFGTGRKLEGLLVVLCCLVVFIIPAAIDGWQKNGMARFNEIAR